MGGRRAASTVLGPPIQQGHGQQADAQQQADRARRDLQPERDRPMLAMVLACAPAHVAGLPDPPQLEGEQRDQNEEHDLEKDWAHRTLLSRNRRDAGATVAPRQLLTAQTNSAADATSTSVLLAISNAKANAGFTRVRRRWPRKSGCPVRHNDQSCVAESVTAPRQAAASVI